ncbi:MAG: 2,3-bisphosphoglycerate-independent phosphoglycerate mutase [Pseudomonadota bacterium]|nr:2,3-bisphosphoglycerate-independent phosphoglycerate mutase [Pseudomonadota bacterium]
MNKSSDFAEKNNNSNNRTIMLCILDGWGERDGGDDNAIHQAHTPNWDRMIGEYPSSRLKASDLDVGLPDGQMGNSEVGHMNLGAGRIVMQDLPLIDQAIQDATLQEIPALVELIMRLKESKGVCHLVGLTSPGGVHSHQNHLIALGEILNNKSIPSKLHAFMDGRDTSPLGGKKFITDIIKKTSKFPNFSIATITGRYWAMDRDNNWDRTERAYNAIAEAEGLHSDDPINAIQNSYDNGKTDEFMLPIIIGDYKGINDGDGILMFNFRSDRARQIISCFADPDFCSFKKVRNTNLIAQVTMTEYSSHISQYTSALFPQRELKKILGEVVSEAGLKQLRAAETEKYAHVTFFFNGGREKIFPKEERILVPSPKVETYDQQPEMSALELTNKIVNAIKSEKFDLIIANFANGDMVGHTGIYEAAVKAAETIDDCLKKLEEALIEVGGSMLITADHGNLEQMNDHQNNGPHTAHTLSPVPVIIVNPPKFVESLREGVLADVAPTLLQLLELRQPEEMTGTSLIIGKNSKNAFA